MSASVHAEIPPPPPGSRNPQGQTHPEQTPPGSRHPPGGRHPPEQTPPGADNPRSRHPPWSRHPPPTRDTATAADVRYASYWNAFLLVFLFLRLAIKNSLRSITFSSMSMLHVLNSKFRSRFDDTKFTWHK